MTSADKDILFTGSQNLSDDSAPSTEDLTKEGADASIRALEKQGIFLEGKKDRPLRTKPREEFTQELQDMGGIEIIPSDDKEV
jgi:hypothetical protein